MKDERTQRMTLEQAEEFYEFLQGKPPTNYRFSEESQPHLSRVQAGTVLYFLSERYRGLYIPDTYERCDVCDALYDGETEGTCLDFGSEPHHFCEDCENGFEYQQKILAEAESMNCQAHRDKVLRQRLLEFADATEQGDDGLTMSQRAARLRLIVSEVFPEPETK